MMNVTCIGRIFILSPLVIVSECNAVAHELARQALVGKDSSVWIDEPPASIRQRLINDVTILSDE